MSGRWRWCRRREITVIISLSDAEPGLLTQNCFLLYFCYYYYFASFACRDYLIKRMKFEGGESTSNILG